MMKTSGLGLLLVMGLILGACTTAPISKNSKKEAAEETVARRKRIEAEVDRFLANLGTPLSEMLEKKLITAISHLEPAAQKDATEAVMSYIQNQYRNYAIKSLNQISELPEKEVEQLVTEVLKHPGLFKVTQEALTDSFAAELKSYAQTGRIVADDVVAKNLPAAYQASEVQAITNKIYEGGLVAPGVAKEVRKDLTIKLAEVNERAYQVLGEPVINLNTCGLAQGLSEDATRNVIDLYERQIREFEESGMSAYCYKNQGVASTFDGWYRETLGGTAATSEELIAQEGERAVALGKECELVPGYLRNVGATMANTRAMPFVAGCPVR